MFNYLLVGLGSFCGGLIRYWVALLFVSKKEMLFPYSTLLVNISGCFLIGIILGLYAKGHLSNEVKLLLITGFLGGFTTFSAFSMETVLLIKQGLIIQSILYILASVVLGLLATGSAYYLFK